MTIKRISAAIAATMAITAIATTTTACDTSSDTPPVSIGSNAPLGGPSNLVGTSTTSKAPKEAAEDQAQAAVKKYLSVYAGLDAFRTSDVNGLNAVAGDPLLTGAKGDLIARRSKGVKNAGGDPSIVPGSVRVVRSDLPDSGTGKADIEIVVCMDQSKYRPVWPDGRSAQMVGAHDRIKRQWWISNDQYPDSAGWLVVGQSAKANAPCDA